MVTPPITRDGGQGAPAVARASLDVGREERRAAPVLRVDGVEKAFHHGLWPLRRRVQVLRGACLEVRRGEIVGLVGENGSGKSTLLQIVVGLLRADAGTVTRAGRLGYCPQEPLLWEKLTIGEHLALYGRAYDLARDVSERRGEELLSALDFRRYVDFRVDELSGGTRQKLNLALALLHAPDVLVLDEPYAGFDWETYLTFWRIAADRRAGGMGLLIVSHLLPERERLDRVYELRDGTCTEP